MYQALRPSTSHVLPIRHMRYNVRTWGQPQQGVPPLVLVHGWMDMSASYQFVVDAFSQPFYAGRHIIAPDWRGFGHSMPTVSCDHYHFADYLGDLDALLDHYVPAGQPVDLVGHSMGGHVAMLYAGARPARIRRLVNLEGFGLAATQAYQAPQRIGRWMDEIKQLRREEIALQTYDNREAVAARLRKTNRRLSEDKALWLAGEWAAPNAQGRWAILGDAAHKVVSAQLFRVDEVLAHYAAITADVLAVEASDDSLGTWWKGQYDLAAYHQRLQSVPHCHIERVADASHMLHHDQPHAVAKLIEDFCTIHASEKRAFNAE